MKPEKFIEKHIRDNIPNITQQAIESAFLYYRRSSGSAKGKVFEECLKIAKQNMVKR